MKTEVFVLLRLIFLVGRMQKCDQSAAGLDQSPEDELRHCRRHALSHRSVSLPVILLLRMQFFCCPGSDLSVTSTASPAQVCVVIRSSCTRAASPCSPSQAGRLPGTLNQGK